MTCLHQMTSDADWLLCVPAQLDRCSLNAVINLADCKISAASGCVCMFRRSFLPEIQKNKEIILIFYTQCLDSLAVCRTDRPVWTLRRTDGLITCFVFVCFTNIFHHHHHLKPEPVVTSTIQPNEVQWTETAGQI